MIKDIPNMPYRIPKLISAIILAIILLLIGLSFTIASAAENTFVINNTLDRDDASPGDGVCDSDATLSGEQCTLRAAISEANASAGVFTITVPAGTYTLAITGTHEDDNVTGDLDINSDIHLIGAGPDQTIIQGGATISQSVDRVFHILNGINTLLIRDLTIRHGYIANSGTVVGQIDDGAGIFVVGQPNATVHIQNTKITHNHNLDLREDGGGLANMGGGTVIIRDSEISHNKLRGELGSSGGGIFSVFGSDTIIFNSVISENFAGGKGGGIYTNRDGATVRISQSLIANNYATDIGGGIQSGATVYLTNTTVSGNATASTGGGVSNDSPESQLYLYHTTIANNIADFDQDNHGDGGGIHLISGTIIMSNSIIAGNWQGDNTANDCTVDRPIVSTYSLIQTMTGCLITGTNLLTNTDPHLRPLADYGGQPSTHALSSTSPLIDLVPLKSSGCDTNISQDQIGQARPLGSGCEPGAYEWQAYQLTIHIAGEGKGTVSSLPTNHLCSEDCSQLYDYGTEVALIAIAADNSEFLGWSGDLSGGTSAFPLLLRSDKVVTATFGIKPPDYLYLPMVLR
ncbi:MAG: choice-of-anchor Q domain-containing protein [Chloroflexota bacterium]